MIFTDKQIRDITAMVQTIDYISEDEERVIDTVLKINGAGNDKKAIRTAYTALRVNQIITSIRARLGEFADDDQADDLTEIKDRGLNDIAELLAVGADMDSFSDVFIADVDNAYIAGYIAGFKDSHLI